MKSQSSPRLASLDILRGFDLFLLLFFQPVLCAVLSKVDAPWSAAILYHFDHEVWNGFRFWDIIMPLFLFMSGASMPFSFSMLRREKPLGYIYRKVLRRFVLLFLLGMVVQGNLLGFDLQHIYIYTNTLQAIGTGYLFSAIIILNMKFVYQVLAAFLLLVVYSLPFLISGEYGPEVNFATKVDIIVLGRFAGDPTYTWVWSSLTFTVTVLFGTFAGQIIKQYKDRKEYASRILFACGVVLVIIALITSLVMPVNKRIWSASMTLLSGGYCFLLMWLFFYWIDCRGHHRGLEWLKIYGMNSIAAYMIGEVVNFRSIAYSLSYGLESYLGGYYPAWITFFNFSIVFGILHYMYSHKIFLKI